MPSINEIRHNQPGDDFDFFEIAGAPGESLDGLSFLAVSGEFEPGQIDSAVSLDGFEIQDDGVFALGQTGLAGLDAEEDYALFGSPVTYFLVDGFTGAANDDLDTDNDGAFDATPWTAVLDAVTFIDGDGTPDVNYAEALVDNDGDFTSAHSFRLFDEVGAFQPGLFGDLSNDTPGAANLSPAIAINELRISSGGDSDDITNFVELFGPAGTDLTGLDLLVLSGEFAPGQVDFAFALDGVAMDADGFALIAQEGSEAPLEPTDLTADFDFFGSPSTFLVVENFTGAAGDDLDADDDGILDATPFGAILDSVSVIDGDDTPDRNYAPTVIGPDGDFAPAAIARAENGTGEFQQGAFGDTGADTPGETNTVEIPTVLTPIYTIQGAGHVSTFDGAALSTSGIVTATDTNGFFLQDPAGDGDDATSDAIFVFTGSAPDVAVGDAVEVSGTVSEFFPGGRGTGNLPTTQISAASVSVTASGNDLPAATVLGGEGRAIPTGQFTEATEIGQFDLGDPADNAARNFDPTLNSVDFFESIEGMLVTATDVVSVSGTDRFGQIFGLVDGGEGVDRNDRGGVTIGGEDLLTADFNPSRIQIDEDTGILPGFGLPVVNTGTPLGDVTGVVTYDFGEFNIHPTEPFTAGTSEVAREITALVGDEDTLTVAAYNVLNLDPNDEDENPASNDAEEIAASGDADVDGGDADIADGRFADIAAQIVENLAAPDIIALQEVQDNNGTPFQGDGVTAADATLQLLIDEIEAAGGPTYELIDNPFVGDQTNGGFPAGNIRTAFLYNPERVDFAEGSERSVADPDIDPNTLDINTPSQFTDETNPFFNSRPPLSATFTFNGEEVTVVSVHNSSRSGSTPLTGAIQQPDIDTAPNFRETEREEQSAALNAFADSILAESPDANIVITGDFNAFQFEDWADILEGDILNNLTDTVDPEDAYSFIFNGNSQALDHSFVSNNLVRDAQLDFVHTNVDFADPEATRASDHDPLVTAIRIDGLTRGDDVITGSAEGDVFGRSNGNDSYTLGDGDDLVIAGAGDDSIDGEAGNDILRGSEGNDVIDGGEGDDRLQGADGNDLIEGGLGDDVLFGSEGDDSLGGGEGDDRLFGFIGDDTLDGGLGDDVLRGGEGDDRHIAGGGGTERHLGGAGGDTFVLGALSDGEIRVLDFDGAEDTILFGSDSGIAGFDDLILREVDGRVAISAEGFARIVLADTAIDDLTDETVIFAFETDV